VLLVSGLKLVNVPTLWIGIVLLACVVFLGAAWLYVRANGRTLREISGETASQMLTGPHRDVSDEPALQTAGSLSEA
jgi:K+-transporting ATPase c subunit